MLASLASLSMTLALGCDPESQLVGSGLPSEAWDVQWRVSDPPQAIISRVAAMPDGGAVIIAQDELGFGQLRRFSAGGAELFSVQLPGRGTRLAVLGSSIFVAGDQRISMEVHRAALWRFSDAGALEASYMHPRPGDANSFGVAMALDDDEVALMVGNWGGLAEGESWHELLRLSHELVPQVEPIPFSGYVEDVGFTESGELLVLETNPEELDLLYTVGDPEPPLEVDCEILIADGSPPICTNTWGELRVTDVETGNVETLGTLGFPEEYGGVRSSRGPSLVFYGAVDDGPVLRVVALREDGTVGAEVEIPPTADAEHLTPIHSSQTSDGAVFVVVAEHKPGEACGAAPGSA
ncbi:MAG: hypothetical protein KDK70_42740, partial [Myxococcales bacterium]|nr:hypothetical protein [Myxococcales bacterium]